MQPLLETKFKAKFPNIIVKWVEPKSLKSLDEFIVNKNVPDIIISGISRVNELKELDLALDLNPLVQKHKLDLNLLYPEALQAVKSYSQHDELYPLPFVNNSQALFYNKDLFDSFGVPYPKDNMTWNETEELAKKVTRQLNGKDIAGIALNVFPAFASGLALPSVDAKTNKAVLNTEGWLRALQKYKEIYSIPGNKFNNTQAPSFLGGDAAMISYWCSFVVNQIKAANDKGTKLNWDLTNLPHFEGQKGTETPSLSSYYITSTSKHPDEAFEAISYLTMAPESLELKASLGRLPTAKLNGVEKVFGQKSDVLKGKNVASLFKMPNLNSPPPAQYSADDEAKKFANQYAKGEQPDARTTLRLAEEAANQRIAGLLNGK
jgi:multiple sugar transport system substrate-binding protein